MHRIQYSRQRAGTLLPILALCMVGLFGFIALAVDLGVLAIVRTECQNAADASALAGARQLNNNPSVSDNNRTVAIATSNSSLPGNNSLNRPFGPANVVSVNAGVYQYDATVGVERFVASFPGSLSATQSWSAMRVTLQADTPTFFSKIFGIQSMPTGAEAVAVHRPRDIAFVLDFSGSMGYGSPLNWPVAGNPVEGLMNPDPDYPKFGHYSRYTFYQTNNPTTSSGTLGNANPSSRPNPLQMKSSYGNYAPNNFTMDSYGGPPMVEDFITAPGDPGSVNSSTAFLSAFKMWSPAQTALSDPTTLTKASFDYSGYDATVGACPAPSNFDLQSDSPVPYVGDKWPRLNGTRGDQATAWATKSGNTITDNSAKTLRDFTAFANTGTAGRDLSTITLPGGGNGATLLPSGKDGGNSNANHLDAVWERYGYDIDMEDWRSQVGATRTVNLLPAAQRFKGYSMGPNYWGKTFFVWPPDPRWGNPTGGAALGGSVNPATVSTTADAQDSNGNYICDWRRRFFLRGDGVQLDPQVDNINRILFRSSTGHVLNTVVTTPNGTDGAAGTPGYYRINYAAVIAWLKSGPKTLPTNLRAGRILYYSTMPNDVTNSAAGDANDKMFLRHYIHYVLGVDEFDSANAPLQTWQYPANRMLAGIENRYPFGTVSQTAPAAFTPTGSMSANREPYMCTTDNINRPRMHFWFGPETMLSFMERAGEDRPWWAGTVREAQCWQLKAAISSILDDIRNNHPNDFCGMSYFATRNHFNKPMAPMGQDWFTLRNVLFFPKDTVTALAANPTATTEDRPYTTSFGNDVAQIPNGSGATDPMSGLAVAFNLLSSSTMLSATDYGNRARRGAAKVVIFETDGIPNTVWNWSLTGTGVNTRYSKTGTAEQWSGDSSLNTAGRAAVAIVKRITDPASTSAVSGYSTPNTPARVYSIAFGDLFNDYDGTNFASLNGTARAALQFLLRVQQVGNTSGPGDPPSVMIPFEQVIGGPYQRPNPALPESASNPPGRVEKLRTGLERIMQSGVQVTLIQ